MTLINKIISASLIVLYTLALSACSPEIGSENWCSNMKEKAKGEWTTNEATDFAKHCIF